MIASILISIFAIGGIIVMFWILFVLDQEKDFNKYLKKGDVVDWYLGEERRRYTLEKFDDDWAELRNDNGTIRKVRTRELHPNLWYKYKK